MKRRGMGLVLVGMLVLAPAAWAQTGGDEAKDVSPEAMKKAVFALSSRIDQLLAASWEKAGIKPAPLATHSQYFRRLNLDLTGRIPELLPAIDYRDNITEGESEWGWLATSSIRAIEQREIRWEWVEKLLVRGQHNLDPDKNTMFARHWAAVFRNIMLPSTAANNLQFGNLRPGFESWLRGKLNDKVVPYDKIAHELLTANSNDGRFFNPGAGGSPGGFFFANENKAENVAGAVGRIFLGVKIECAQCHAHPFAKWQQQQFWEFAAFFSGLGNQFGGGRPQPFNPNSRKITIPGTNKEVTAKFLDGTEPKWKDGVNTRTILAEWMVASENPYFAKAAVDTVWTYFFGNSLLEPILEPSDDYPVTYPELLDELAQAFVKSGYDLKFLVRAIVHSEAYQRSSEGGKDADKLDYFFFARMPVRSMSPEQLFDSLCEATDYPDDSNPNVVQQPFGGQPNLRADFLSRFASIEKRTESSTSILQALFLMNGKFFENRTKLNLKLTHDDINSSDRKSINVPLHRLAFSQQPAARTIETLYLNLLSRPPRPEELQRLVRYVERGGPSRDSRLAIADVYWALLNSGEFMLNH